MNSDGKNVTSLAWCALNPIASYYEVAKVVYAMYSDRIVCVSIEDNIWYKYENQCWRKMDRAYDLRILISSEVVSVFEKTYDDCTANYMISLNDADKKIVATKMSACTKMIKNLKSAGYKTILVEECAKHFYDPDFINKLNENRNKLGHRNFDGKK